MKSEESNISFTAEETNLYVENHMDEFIKFENEMNKEWGELNLIYNNWMEKYHSVLFRTELPMNLNDSQQFFGQSIRDLFVCNHTKITQLGQE